MAVRCLLRNETPLCFALFLLFRVTSRYCGSTGENSRVCERCRTFLLFVLVVAVVAAAAAVLVVIVVVVVGSGSGLLVLLFCRCWRRCCLQSLPRLRSVTPVCVCACVRVSVCERVCVCEDEFEGHVPEIQVLQQDQLAHFFCHYRARVSEPKQKQRKRTAKTLRHPI